jgi:hypothetical protein
MSTHIPASNEPEFLGSGAAAELADPRRAHRRGGVVAAAAVAVVAAAGAGTYGVLQLMTGGSSPATAIPADALGYVSLDLDPSASQKIEAFKLLRKFPAIKEELGGTDDVRKAVFEGFREGSDCKGLDYAKDVEPWIGDRIAVAAVPDERHGALPLVTLQVTDQAKAKSGFARLSSCDGSEAPGISFVGDYMLVSYTQKQVDAMAADAERAALADSEAFTTAMQRVGDPGIISMYVAKDAPGAFVTAQKKATADNPGSTGIRPEQVSEAFEDFEGAAGVVRFEGGAVEAELSAKGLASKTSSATTDVGSLPATTAAAFALSLPDGWAEDYLDLMSELSPEGESADEMLREAERATGLRLPEDIETLFGDGISVSVDGSVDLGALTEAPDPTRVPAGIRIQGDPDRITPIIDKLKALAGPDADIVTVGIGDGVVAVGLDARYVDSLLETGTLGGQVSFSDVVPDADRASGVFFLDFDAGNGWAERLGALLSDDDPAVTENLAPLGALGVSAWEDDDKIQHSLLRLTTD